MLDAVTISIQPEEFEEANALATESLRRFAGRQGYYNNNHNSHLRGKLGEIAATRVLADMGLQVEPLWRDLSRMSDADIVVGNRLRADVKTWSERHWTDLGRCVAVGQLPALQRKSDLILWCTSDDQVGPGMRVTVEGWNTLDDVATAPRRLTGPRGGRQVDNYQLDPASLRPLGEVAHYLN